MSDFSLSADELRKHLQEIDPYQLEELIADLWVAMGYDAEATSGARDRGIDIVATKEDPFQRKQVIQVKRYSDQNLVGSSDIRLYRTLYDQQNNIDLVGIVTTSGFTDDALALARDLDVRTMNGDILSRYLIRELDIKTISEYLTLEDEQSGSNKTNSDTAENLYGCFYCDDSFSTQSEAREHIQEWHTGEEVGQVDAFNSPNAAEQADESVPCPICESSLIDESAMREHIKRSHPDRILCRYCEKYFREESGIREHLSKSHEFEKLSRIDQKRVEIYEE